MSTDEAERMPRPKKIDTALIGIAFSIVLQLGAGIWLAATMNTRIEALEQQIAPMQAIVETVARLDERTKGIERIERKLDGLEARR